VRRQQAERSAGKHVEGPLRLGPVAVGEELGRGRPADRDRLHLDPGPPEPFHFPGKESVRGRRIAADQIRDPQPAG
jgi:hypothetical protein